MKIESSKVFPEVLIFTPTIYEDVRGAFFESYNKIISDKLNVEFIQENHSISKKNVVRGLHYQWDQPSGKICRVVRGTLIDFVVDIRKDSPTLGKYDSILLDDIHNKIIWIPPGFAHGFLSVDNNTHLLYKCTAEWNKNGEGSIYPFDSDINIDFPIPPNLTILSEKDKFGQSFNDYCKAPKF